MEKLFCLALLHRHHKAELDTVKLIERFDEKATAFITQAEQAKTDDATIAPKLFRLINGMW
jgi:hypothetical protein